MAKRNAHNTRIKRRYLDWLRQARGLSESSVDRAAASVDRWLDYLKGADLRRFHSDKAIAFKKGLEQETTASGAVLSDASRDGILRDLKAFFKWLADQAGYRSKIRYEHADWFTPDRRIARASHRGQWRPHPSPEQVRAAILNMPSETVFQRRDRALMAFLFLTGSREKAAMTVRLRHIDLANGCVQFDGKDVQTKFGKRFTTFFCPVGEDIEAIFSNWMTELNKDLLFGPDDPVFPRTEVKRSAQGLFEPAGLERSPWCAPGAVVRIFREAFVAAGLPSFTPHRIRNTLVDLASLHCRTPEDFKAWSQNIGHDDVLTTFRSYGTVAPGRQREIMARFRKKKDGGECV